jgi:hypothetical protein
MNAYGETAGNQFTGEVDIDGDLVVSGDGTFENLTVNDTLTATTIITEQELEVIDPLILCGKDNPADTVNLGLLNEYTGLAGKRWDGLIRSGDDKSFYLLNNQLTKPTPNSDIRPIGGARGLLGLMFCNQLNALNVDLDQSLFVADDIVMDKSGSQWKIDKTQPTADGQILCYDQAGNRTKWVTNPASSDTMQDTYDRSTASQIVTTVANPEFVVQTHVDVNSPLKVKDSAGGDILDISTPFPNFGFAKVRTGIAVGNAIPGPPLSMKTDAGIPCSVILNTTDPQDTRIEFQEADAPKFDIRCDTSDGNNLKFVANNITDILILDNTNSQSRFTNNLKVDNNLECKNIDTESVVYTRPNQAVAYGETYFTNGVLGDSWFLGNQLNNSNFVLKNNTGTPVIEATQTSGVTIEDVSTANISVNTISKKDLTNVIINDPLQCDENVNIVENKSLQLGPVAPFGGLNPIIVSKNAGYICSLQGYSNDTTSPNITINKARGNNVSPTSILVGDSLGSINLNGYGTTFSSGAIISATADENWSSSNQGTSLKFFTTKNGQNASIERMRIDKNGLVSIGQPLTGYRLPDTRGNNGDVLKTDGSGNVTWQTDSDSGDVNGPVSSTNNGVVRFNGVTGKIIKDSSWTISDTGVMTDGISSFTGASGLSTPEVRADKVFIRDGIGTERWEIDEDMGVGANAYKLKNSVGDVVEEIEQDGSHKFSVSNNEKLSVTAADTKVSNTLISIDSAEVRLNQTSAYVANPITVVLKSDDIFDQHLLLKMQQIGLTNFAGAVPVATGDPDGTGVIGISVDNSVAAGSDIRVAIGGTFEIIVESGTTVTPGDLLEKSDAQAGRCKPAVGRGSVAVALTGGTGDGAGSVKILALLKRSEIV